MEAIKFVSTPKCKDCYKPDAQQLKRPGCYGCKKGTEQQCQRDYVTTPDALLLWIKATARNTGNKKNVGEEQLQVADMTGIGRDIEKDT